jgi:hypothetical protein
MPDSEFAEDLKSFFLNLGYVAEKSANLVIEGLKDSVPSQTRAHALSSQTAVG